jgi:hypothetical protein
MKSSLYAHSTASGQTFLNDQKVSTGLTHLFDHSLRSHHVTKDCKISVIKDYLTQCTIFNRTYIHTVQLLFTFCLSRMSVGSGSFNLRALFATNFATTFKMNSLDDRILIFSCCKSITSKI